MVLIEFYVIFAVATAITSWWAFFRPLINEARANEVENALVESPLISGMVFIVIAFFLAPFIISALVSATHGELFRTGLQRVIEESDN